MSGEFDLIRKFFYQRQKGRTDVHLGLGDDCAIVKTPESMRLAISTDTLVAGTHFVVDASPAWVAHKALASNLSDLAAMGAIPAWCVLALTLPEVNENWLHPFCEAFFELADRYDIQLIGGDTTKGPLTISLTIHGFVPDGLALTRSGAKAGDWIYVTGNLGASKAGLEWILSGQSTTEPFIRELEKQHYVSTPRIAAGQKLLNVASSAIDISDGLASDILHVLDASGVGANIDVSRLPLSAELLQYLDHDIDLARQYALTSGEEYELCFTVPPHLSHSLAHISIESQTPFSCIGQICAEKKVILHEHGQPVSWSVKGYDHFKVDE